MRPPQGGAHVIAGIGKGLRVAPETSAGAGAAGTVVERRRTAARLCGQLGDALGEGASSTRRRRLGSAPGAGTTASAVGAAGGAVAARAAARPHGPGVRDRSVDHAADR